MKMRTKHINLLLASLLVLLVGQEATAFVVTQCSAPVSRKSVRVRTNTETSREVEKPNLTNQEEINASQARAEADARAAHDNYAMNALFVNVKEHPVPEACTIEEGSIPSDLPAGCLLRIGPNGQTKDEGWLDGDGLIQCVTLPPDSAEAGPTFSSTYVETRGRTLEKQVENKRFRGTLGAAPHGLPMLQNLVQNGVDFQTMVVQKDTCNTALALSGDRVMALMEQSPPSEIQVFKDGRIETVDNMCRLDGAVVEAPISGGAFGAHGRTHPTTGERVHVTYSSSMKPYVRVDSFQDDWKLVSSIGVDTAAPTMIHDSAITDNYVVILDFPLTVRPSRFLQNSFPVEYEPDHGARIGLTLRRESVNGEPQTLWFDVEAGVTLHVANAFERDDDTVVIHGFKSIPKGESSYILDYTPAFLHEWVLDPATMKVVSDRCLNADELVEFPMVEERLVARENDYIYGLQSTTIGGPLLEAKTPQVGVLLDGVVKFSVVEETAGAVVDRYTLEPGWHFCAEPTPVTKTSGDGVYLLLIATFVPEEGDRSLPYDVMARDGTSLKSRMIILDSEDMESGPVTKIGLPHHVNYGLHGMFLPWEKMA